MLPRHTSQLFSTSYERLMHKVLIAVAGYAFPFDRVRDFAVLSASLAGFRGYECRIPGIGIQY